MESDILDTYIDREHARCIRAKSDENDNAVKTFKEYLKDKTESQSITSFNRCYREATKVTHRFVYGFDNTISIKKNEKNLIPSQQSL